MGGEMFILMAFLFFLPFLKMVENQYVWFE